MPWRLPRPLSRVCPPLQPRGSQGHILCCCAQGKDLTPATVLLGRLGECGRGAEGQGWLAWGYHGSGPWPQFEATLKGPLAPEFSVGQAQTWLQPAGDMQQAPALPYHAFPKLCVPNKSSVNNLAWESTAETQHAPSPGGWVHHEDGRERRLEAELPESTAQSEAHRPASQSP